MTEKPITFDRVVRWVGTGLLIIGIILLLNRLSHVLLPFFVAWFFAYLLYPMVKFVERRLHLPRALSIIIALIVVIAIISGIVYLIIPPMIEQFEKLGNLATDYIQKSAHITSIPGAFSEWITDNEHEIQQFFKSKDFSDGMKAIMPELFNFLGQTYSVIVSVIASFIALLYMFFILLDYEYLTDNWIRIFPKKNRPFWQELAKDVERELNNYIRGQGLVALIMGVLFCIDRLPHGHRSGHHDRPHGPRALSAHLRPDPHCTAGTPESSRHRPEFLGDPDHGTAGIHHRTADLRHGGNAEGDGQGHGSEPSHSAALALCMGCAAGIHRTDYRPAAHHAAHSLLPAICDKRQ